MKAALKYSTALKENPERPDIFEYNDYRPFLKDWFDHLSVQEKNFSVRSLAMSASLSANYLSNVLSGRSPISEKALFALESKILLSKQEFSFLKHLVHLVDSKNIEEQIQAFKKIKKFTDYKIKNKKELAAYQYLSSWHYIAIRELALQKGFKSDPKWIQGLLEKKISLSDIQDALNFLKENEYIPSDENPGKKQASIGERIAPKGSVFKLALSRFYKQNYELCLSAIYKIARKDRFLTSHTAGLSESAFKEAREVMEEALEKIHKISANDKGKPKKIYHFSLFGFPYTKTIPSDESYKNDEGTQSDKTKE